MTLSIEAAYDSVAELYASMFLNELDRDAQSQLWLQQFADLVNEQSGLVVDVGCGPGGAVDHLTGLGLDVLGIDFSPGQIEQARIAFPELAFRVGDMTFLDFADCSIGGIVSKHSIIHLKPETLPQVFMEWRRVVVAGAPLFLSFFGSRSLEAHGTAFDHKVATAYELFPATIVEILEATGFTDVRFEAVPISKGKRPYDHTTVLALSPSTQ